MTGYNGHGQNGGRKYTVAEQILIQDQSRSRRHNLDRIRHELGIIGSSNPMQEVYKAIEMVCPYSTTVLLTGETGTGKDLVARAIHTLSKKSKFVVVNCPEIPKDLIEAELFGYKQGSFTGSKSSRVGLLRYAHGGTLFLNEIGELDTTLQAKLLGFVENRTVRRLGENKTYVVNTRIIAATNKDLYAMTKQGAFREDLYHRLAVVTIELPPLRERREDIPLLIDHFLEVLSNEYKKNARVFEQDEYNAYKDDYPWSGNARELRNALETIVVTGIDPRAKLDELILKSQRHDNTDDKTKTLHEANYGLNLHDLLTSYVVEYGSIDKSAKKLGIPASTLRLWLKRYDNQSAYDSLYDNLDYPLSADSFLKSSTLRKFIIRRIEEVGSKGGAANSLGIDHRTLNRLVK